MTWFFALIGIASATEVWQSSDELAAQVAQSIERVRPSFPELNGIRIRIGRIATEKDYFFETNVRVSEAFRSPRSRTYELNFNPSFFENPPSLRALDSITAHELSHILGYIEMGPLDLGWLLARYLFSTSFHSRYEKQTDSEAIRRGFGEGLIEYRQWLYRGRSESFIAKKKANYLTVAEIRAQLPTR